MKIAIFFNPTPTPLCCAELRGVVIFRKIRGSARQNWLILGK